MTAVRILADDELVTVGAAHGDAVAAALLAVKDIPLCGSVFGQVDALLEVVDFLLTGREHVSNHSRAMGKGKPIFFFLLPIPYRWGAAVLCRDEDCLSLFFFLRIKKRKG